MMRYISFTLVAFLCGVDAGTIKKLRGNSNNVVSSATKRKLQHHGHQTQRRLASMLFKESTCNENITSAECISIDTFLSNQSPSSSEVKIECGQCVSFDTTDNTFYNFTHGFNIVGKLKIPENASFELLTKYVLVQGLLQMDAPIDTKLPRSDEAAIKIILTGTDNVQFYPDSATENELACDMGNTGTAQLCNVGIKPFAVAGGRLDINAIDENCPSWTKLKSLSVDLFEIELTDPLAADCWAPGA